MLLNPQEAADLVTFTEEILNGKLHLLCSGCCVRIYIYRKTRKTSHWAHSCTYIKCFPVHQPLNTLITPKLESGHRRKLSQKSFVSQSVSCLKL